MARIVQYRPHIVLIVLAILFSFGVSGFSYCDDLVQPNVTCQLVTPSLSCTGYVNYSIVNESGVQVGNGNLTLLYDNIYILNFTEGVGRYVVSVCDGSSKQLKVGDDNMSFLAALVILPMLFGFLILYWMSLLDEDHKILKNVFGILGWFSFVLSMHFGVVVLAKFYGFVEMIQLLASTTYWIVLIAVVIVLYWMFYYLHKHLEKLKELKNKKMSY